MDGSFVDFGDCLVGLLTLIGCFVLGVVSLAVVFLVLDLLRIVVTLLISLLLVVTCLVDVVRSLIVVVVGTRFVDGFVVRFLCVVAVILAVDGEVDGILDEFLLVARDWYAAPLRRIGFVSGKQEEGSRRLNSVLRRRCTLS